MWKKLTEEEIAEARIRSRNMRKRIAILTGMGFSLLFIFVRSRGWSAHYSSPFVSLDEIPARIPVALIFGILFGWVIYQYPAKRQSIMICPHCEATKREDSETHCPCGGQFVNIETMKWVKHK
jgi:hypothetical protein